MFWCLYIEMGLVHKEMKAFTIKNVRNDVIFKNIRTNFGSLKLDTVSIIIRAILSIIQEKSFYNHLLKDILYSASTCILMIYLFSLTLYFIFCFCFFVNIYFVQKYTQVDFKTVFMLLSFLIRIIKDNHVAIVRWFRHLYVENNKH
jgi:hypothetical protein